MTRNAQRPCPCVCLHARRQVKSRLQDVIGRSLGTFDALVATQHPSLAALDRLRSARSQMSARSGCSSVGGGGGGGDGCSSRSSSFSAVDGLGFAAGDGEADGADGGDEDYRGGVRSEGETGAGWGGAEAWRAHAAAAAAAPHPSALHPALRSSRNLLAASAAGSSLPGSKTVGDAAALVTATEPVAAAAPAAAAAAAAAAAVGQTAAAGKVAPAARFADTTDGGDGADRTTEGAAPAAAAASSAVGGAGCGAGAALKMRGVSFRAVSFRGLAPDSDDDDDEDGDGDGDGNVKKEEDDDDGDPLGLGRKASGAGGSAASDEEEEEVQPHAPQPVGVFLTEANVRAHTSNLQSRATSVGGRGNDGGGLRTGGSKRSMGREASGASRAAPPAAEPSTLSGVPMLAAAAAGAGPGSEARRPPVQPLQLLPPYGNPPPAMARTLSMSSMDSTVVKVSEDLSPSSEVRRVCVCECGLNDRVMQRGLRVLRACVRSFCVLKVCRCYQHGLRQTALSTGCPLQRRSYRAWYISHISSAAVHTPREPRRAQVLSALGGGGQRHGELCNLGPLPCGV